MSKKDKKKNKIEKRVGGHLTEEQRQGIRDFADELPEDNRTQLEKQSFTDWKGNTWYLDIDTVLRRRIKRNLGFDLMNASKPAPKGFEEMDELEKKNHPNMQTEMQKMDTDMIDECVWECVKEQATHLGFNEVQFFKLVWGKEPTQDWNNTPSIGESCYVEMVQAWIAALVNFIQKVGAKGTAKIFETMYRTTNFAREEIQKGINDLAPSEILMLASKSTGTESLTSSVNSVESGIETAIKKDLHFESSSEDTKPK